MLFYSSTVLSNRVWFGVSAFTMIFGILGASDANAAESNILFKPRISVAGEYNSNIYTENKNLSKPNSDFILKISPGLNIRSGDTRNFIEGDFNLEQQLYKKHDRNDQLNGNARLRGRHYFDPSLMWDGGARYTYSHSNRGDNDANPTAVSRSPMATAVFTAQTSIRKTFGSFNLQPRLSFEDRDHKDGRRFNGRVIDRSGQNRDVYTAGIRAGYHVDKATEVYADVSRLSVDYDKRLVVDRNSDGGTYLVGTRYRPNKAVDVNVAIGMTERNYKASNFDNINTIAARMDARWIVQEGSQLRLRLAYGDYLNESTSANVGGIVPTNASLRFTQDITPELQGWAQLRYNKYNYKGGKGSDSGLSDRKDTLIRLSLGADYALTQAAKISLSAEHTKRDSNAKSAEYKRNTVLLGLNYEF